MNAAELIKNIVQYGADEEGIRDRFENNAELYERCFRGLLDEPNFALLSEAMKAHDYKNAFEAAHALKGISGNLSVTGLYNAVCALVESLRANSYGDIDAQHAEVMRQLAYLKAFYSGKAAEAEAPVKRRTAERPAELNGGKTNADAPKKADRFLLLSIAVVLAVIMIVGLMFFEMMRSYSKSIVMESGSHLSETSAQICTYIEARIANDWRVAFSIGDSLIDGSYANDDAVFNMLLRKREVWAVSDLMLYTEDGLCIYSDGSIERNDIASSTINKARKQGKYMSIIESNIIYTVPLETALYYKGSRVAAISAVQEMGSFLDEMNVSSYEEEAWMYLTDENGVVLSMLSNDGAIPAYNFKAVVGDAVVEPLSEGHTSADLFSSADATAFLITDHAGANYVVSSPIHTGQAPLILFYVVPEEVANRTMNAFSNQLTRFSAIVIAAFAILSSLSFLFMYRSKKRMFDKAMLARERMFDLLVKNTRTAFGLFTVNQPEPEYISSNTMDVIGDNYWSLHRTAAGFSMRSSVGEDTEAVVQANAQLGAWDGESVFKSGYIHDSVASPPCVFEFTLYPVDDAGESYIGIAQDVTQAYEREEMLKEALEMAARSGEAKSRFLSSMSHDIRTPMNAIMNMTNFALESIDNPPKLEPYLNTIREASEHLLALINDVLDMSRIESGQTVIASEPFDIKAEMQRQADIIRPLCEARRQTFITDFDGLCATAVYGDALKISQIVMNLLSNAVKFTLENGTIRFIAREIPSLRDDIVDVRFTFEDNGIGISKEDMPRIFEPFSRAEDRRIKTIQGTGLGLAICKSYVDAMGGMIRCESEKGEGSVFTVELFFQKADVAPVEAAVSSVISGTPFKGLRCMVAEDNITNQMIAKALLERLGFAVDFAGDGGEALQMFLHSAPDVYDVIYMDIQMPVLDGLEATKLIRASKHPQANTIPIIAMTANVFAEDIEKARLSGMNAFLGKPIIPASLIKETNKAMNNIRRDRV